MEGKQVSKGWGRDCADMWPPSSVGGRTVEASSPPPVDLARLPDTEASEERAGEPADQHSVSTTMSENRSSTTYRCTQGSPLTTRHRSTTLRLGGDERAGAWRRVRRRPTTLYKSRCCYSVRAFPVPCAGGQVLVPVAPRLTQVRITVARTNWPRTLQRSTDAWAASPAPARVGSHILRFGCGRQGERDKGHW